jgi:hypothetical protein
MNTRGLIEHPGPSPLEYSPCPHCGAEVDWTHAPAHHCRGTLRAKRPTYDELALAVLAYATLEYAGGPRQELARRMRPEEGGRCSHE